MSQHVMFLVETSQGSFIPVSANLIRIDEVEDCLLDPLSYSMPYVELEQAQAFIHSMSGYQDALVYDHLVKMNPFGLKWLSEVERAQ